LASVVHSLVQRSREAERQRGREAERQRGREAGRQRGRQRGREAERQRGREAERQRGREAERQRGRDAERQRGRDAERLGAAQISPTVATKIGGYAETLNPWIPKLAVLLAAHTIYPKLLRLNWC